MRHLKPELLAKTSFVSSFFKCKVCTYTLNSFGTLKNLIYCNHAPKFIFKIVFYATFAIVHLDYWEDKEQYSLPMYLKPEVSHRQGLWLQLFQILFFKCVWANFQPKKPKEAPLRGTWSGGWTLGFGPIHNLPRHLYHKNAKP